MATNPNAFLNKVKKPTTTKATDYTKVVGFGDAGSAVFKGTPLDSGISNLGKAPAPEKQIFDKKFANQGGFNPVDVPQTPRIPTNSMYQTPTVPTAKNPVVEEVPAKPNTSNVDYSTVDNLDTQGLYRFIDNIQVRASQGEQISAQDQLLLREAQRKVQQSLSPAATTNTYETQISEQQKQREAEAIRLKAIEEANISAEEKRLNALYAQRAAQAQEAGARTSQAAAKSTSFSGFGRSTFNADQQVQIQDAVNQNLAMLDAEKTLATERYRAEQAGATAEQLGDYDERISQLRDKSAQFQLQQAEQINTFNQKNAATYEEKINNLLQYASKWTDPNTPLTEQELATAKAYGQIAIDKDGNVNTALLKEIDPKIMGEVIRSAAEARGAIPTNEFGFINVGGGLVAITDPTTGEVRYEQGQVPKEYSLEKIGDTGYVFDPTTGTTVQAGTTIDRQTATSKYGSTPAVRNFNPGNIMDTGFGGQKVAGERFTRFDTPQQGFNALVAKIQNIQAGNSQVYSPDMTLTQYMSKYAPSSDNNNPQAYANSVAKFLGVPVGTKIGQIDPVKLAEAHAKHEDGNSYQMLKDLGIFGGAKGSTQGGYVPQTVEEEQLLNSVQQSSGKKTLPSGTVTMLSDGRGLPQLVNTLTILVDTNTDIFGPIAGRIAGANEYNTNAQKAQAQLKLAAQTVGKFMEGGVLRKEDEVKYEKMLPTLKDKPEVAKAKIEQVKALLESKYKNYLQDFSNSYDVTGFPVTLFGPTPTNTTTSTGGRRTPPA